MSVQLSPQRQQRINHVWHNVTQADPAMRLQGLRFYAPQLDPIEKAVLYNAMRHNWPHLTNEERHIYTKMAKDADSDLKNHVGSGTGSDVIDDVLDRMGFSQEQLQQAKNLWKNPTGKVSIIIDVSGLAALGFTGLEKTAPPDKAVGLATTIQVQDSQEEAWKKAVAAAASVGYPSLLTSAGNSRINAADFMKLRSMQSDVEKALSFAFSLAGGQGTIRVVMNADADLYDKVANLHIPNLADSIKESAKEAYQNLKPAAWGLGKILAIGGTVVFVGWAAITLLAARFRASSINVQVAK